VDRRDFIRITVGAGAGLSLMGRWGLVGQQTKSPDLVVVENGQPAALVREAVQQLGGMERFVKRGDFVVVKPNISWDRVPEQAATTNPDVVAEVVRMCYEAGAKKVKIFDNTLNDARRCYRRSGIKSAAEEAGADVEYVYERKFKKVRFESGKLVKAWEVYRDVLDADKIINLPIAKHHSISGVSLGMKNFMGLIGGNRGKYHRDFNIKIVDLNTKIRADLTILDAYRMLMRNGPSGGSLADVVIKKTVVAGVDPVAVDSFGASMFGHMPERIGFLNEAHSRGLGEINLNKLRIQKISLSA